MKLQKNCADFLKLTYKVFLFFVFSQKLEIKLVLIGECLGHSASILVIYVFFRLFYFYAIKIYFKSLNTITRNEIISSGYDNMVIIWRNSSIVDYNRNLNINKILSNVNL